VKTTVSSKGQIVLPAELREPRGARRTRLEQWFESGVARVRCLPWDAGTGRRWAQLLAKLRASGKAMPIKDSLGRDGGWLTTSRW
jgi:predicted nucleic acid-binding protein